MLSEVESTRAKLRVGFSAEILVIASPSAKPTPMIRSQPASTLDCRFGSKSSGVADSSALISTPSSASACFSPGKQLR